MGTAVEDGVVQPAKIPYPKSVFFIVANEFCERFCFYGLRTILVLYLNYVLLFSKNESTVIYHVFIMLAYFFPVLGAIIADSWLGRYSTIISLSIVYAIGNILISVTAITGLQLPQKELTIVGLLLIALGTGGIKPCVSAFGGDQFVLPQQDLQLQRFFSLFYFAINSGSLISTFITPILREDVRCFGEESCFPLAFGVPAALMIIAIVAFALGSPWYNKKAPEGNVIVEVAKCIWYARTKRGTQEEKREHWLDKADDRFDKKLIEDIKCALKVLVLYIPVPIFWALFDQQGSRWTFQAARMNGDLGKIYIKPDQMGIFNPVLIVIFIPLFETIFYPALAKCNLIRRPLQKMVVGGTLAGLAFVVSGLIEFQLQNTYPVLAGAGEAQLRLYNGMGCDANVTLATADPILIESLGMYEDKFIAVNETSRDINIQWNDCSNGKKHHTATIYERQATSYTFLSNGELHASMNENLDKSDNGDPMVMFIYSPSDLAVFTAANVTITDSAGTQRYKAQLNKTHISQPFRKVPRGTGYTITVNDAAADLRNENVTYTFEQGGNYVLVASSKGPTLMTSSLQVTAPNSMSMMWLIPQYVILTAGEIMYSIPGLELSFTQAPASMKSLLASAWLLTVAFGNLIVIIVAEAKIFESQAYEFLLFAGLMFLDVLLFMFLAVRYKYTDLKKDSDDVTATSEKNGQIPMKETKHQD